MMLQKSTPEQMSFADWQFILTSGNQQAADQVWNAIKGKALRMMAQVISATTTSAQIAGSEDDIQANKADIELTFATPLTPARVPKPGTQITVQGVPDSYTPNPFMMHMSDGQLITPPRQPSTPARETFRAVTPSPLRSQRGGISAASFFLRKFQVNSYAETAAPSFEVSPSLGIRTRRSNPAASI